MTAAIAMEHVAKGFQGVAVLRDVGWTVPTGSVYGLLGPNGAGKSTLLRLALGAFVPDAGEVTVLGHRLGPDSAAIRERVQYVASGRQIVPRFQVDEWLRYASLAYPRWDTARSRRLLEALEIAPDQAIGKLSSGMRTALQIVVAIAAQPDLLLLDEPTAGLDVVVGRQIVRLFMDMAAAQGTTVVWASHHLDEVERLCDHAALLYGGRILLAGEIDTVKAGAHRLEVVMPGTWPPLTDDSRIGPIEHQGRIAVLTVFGPADDVAETLKRAGATLVRPVNLSLSDVFQAILEREGYTRESLVWRAE
jgi:ABC-2 type transport system ATP-binding protein